MSNLQIIEALTDIVSKQSEIIRIQADALRRLARYVQKNKSSVWTVRSASFWARTSSRFRFDGSSRKGGGSL